MAGAVAVGLPRGPTALLDAARGALLAQRGHLMPWTPVALGAGIAAYLGLRHEPGPAAWAAVAVAALACVLLARRAGPAASPLLLALALMAAGAGLAAWRTHAVAAPVLTFRYYGPIEGRIVHVDRSGSDALRLTLDRVVLERMEPSRTPAHVRLSLRGDQRWLAPEPGRVVMLTGHLSPPSGPAEPGDFDFRRSAWFDGLGAVGYTQSPVLTAAPPEGGLWLDRLRAHLSGAVQARIAGDAGGLAAAVVTGDRAGLSAAANQAMRDAGLYHLVSISGMHMGMLVAFSFGLVRTLVALVPFVALRVDGRKVAAVAALPVAAFYLALAGRDVATERAFVTVAVMLGAILLDRRAVSLRSVAVAALVVLALRPESVANAGFQMSFAAVVALTWAFGGGQPVRSRWIAPVAMLLLSSLVAGLATAPYAGAHFNRFAAYGLLSNLLAVPAMGILVMPGAAILALLGPLGIEQPALLMIDWGCRWILWVSDVVANLDGAAWALPTATPAMLPVLTLGGLFVVLWQGRGRWAGVPVVALALALWVMAERPALLVTESGAVMGVLGPEGRAVSHPTGDGFAVGAWLDNDGEVADQAQAATRPGLAVEERTARAEVGGSVVLLARGKRALAAVEGCGGADVLVTDEEAGARPCVVLDALTLRGSGSVAGWAGADGLRLVTAAEMAGARPWTGP